MKLSNKFYALLMRYMHETGLIAFAFDPTDEDTRKAIADAVKEAVSEATDGLQAKNRELLGKLKKANADGQIDPAEHEKLESELEATKAKLKDAEKQTKELSKRAEAAEQSLQGEQSFTQSLLVDNGLSAALMEAGVKNPAHLKAAAAMLKTGNKIEIKIEEGGKRTAMVGDKPLGDFAKGWAASDEGKHFVTAAANGGGGAAGGGGGGETRTNEQVSKMAPGSAKLAAAREAQQKT